MVKLFTCELGFKKTNDVLFKFLDQKFHSAKAPHIPSTAAPINTYWHNQGLDTHYHTFADILQSNSVITHQVLLDTDIDNFCHPDSGHTLPCDAVNYPEEVPSDNDSA
jgi:hypothetical protein